MKDPTFKLEGVVKESDYMSDFEGPLTLILQLLSKNKIEIKDIKIAELLEQYLGYLEEMKAMDLEIASEFVAMASHLVYIKARMLLATGNEEEPSELEQLIKSLEILQNRDTYDRIKSVTGSLNEMYSRGAGTFVKPPEPVKEDRKYRYVHHKEDLLKALMAVLTRDTLNGAAADNSDFTMPGRIMYPVSSKEKEILDILDHEGSQLFSGLLALSKSRTEVVATFIAVLELCTAGSLMVYGDGENVMVGKPEEADGHGSKND